MNDPRVDEPAFERKDFAGGWIDTTSYFILSRRRPLLWTFIVITIVLGAMATRLQFAAGFAKVVLLHHEYMKTFLEYQNAFGGANKVLIVLKNTRGDISKESMERLRQVTVKCSTSRVWNEFGHVAVLTERAISKSSRTDSAAATSWPPISSARAGTRQRAESDWVGRIVSGDQTRRWSSRLFRKPTGDRTAAQSAGHREKLEAIRAKHEKDGTTVHISSPRRSATSPTVLSACSCSSAWRSSSPRSCSTGTRILMLTSWALICAAVPVICSACCRLHLTLDPMSILVPFLIFSIAVSHAVQMTNAWKLRRCMAPTA
jgi:hypothetical protein